MTEFMRLSAIFARVARDPASQQPHPEVEENAVDTSAGYRYDLYRPRRQAIGLVVAVHGVTLSGNRDPRLIHFARCLARSRIACATPVLPGLSSCRWREEDIDAIGVVALDAADGVGCPPGLLGFSFGGSYALLTASRPVIADRIRFVVTFGACHDLNHLLDGYAAGKAPRGDGESEWDDWIFLQLVLADQYAEEIELPEAPRAEARSLLQRYCHGATAEEKRHYYGLHLEGRDLVGLGSRLRDRKLLSTLSPAGKLGNLRAPISLIHDRGDTAVPLEHGERLYREVATTLGEDRCRFLPTSLLSHVSLGKVFRLGEIGRLYGALALLAEW